MSLIGVVRARLFVPDSSEVTFERRGFHVEDPDAQARLENVGRTFLFGLRQALLSTRNGDLVERLAGIERPMRGFSYEGATMGLTLIDALNPMRGGRVARFVTGAGNDHIYMAHIGVGWAMARLPHMLWRSIIPEDPLLRWLVWDGYGFHQTYFHTRRYVERQFVAASYPAWPGEAEHVNHVVDQGIGRAMWFVNGANVKRVASMIDEFPPERRADLWSGAGLAATYAGGVDQHGLSEFWKAAGEYQPHVAQGAAFAAKARERARLVVSHTTAAVLTFCHCSVAEAGAVTDEALHGLPYDSATPAYELWRGRIRDRLIAEFV